jgi:hypothetical protein
VHLRQLTLTTAVAVLLLAPAAARADGVTVIRDCAFDGKLDKTYSQKDYADALASLAADVDEYLDCRDVIQRARLAAIRGAPKAGGSGGGGGDGGVGVAAGGGPGGGGGAAGGGAGSTAPDEVGSGDEPLERATPAARRSYAAAVTAGAAPVVLDGRPISARDTAAGARSLGDVPGPLLAMLVLAVLGGAGGAVCAVRRRRGARG